MSETLIYGFLVDLEKLAAVPGSKDEALKRKVLESQARALADIDRRFEHCREPCLSAADAVTLYVNGDVEEDHAYEFRCVVELFLRELGENLDDDTDHRSLWYNHQFWLGDFLPVFERLGLSVLASKWEQDSPPMAIPEGNPWPTLTTFTREEARRALEELERADLSRIRAMSDELFTEKSSYEDPEDLKEVMEDNVVQLGRWLRRAAEADSPAAGLVLVFDGDA